ncbi:MAG: HdeD family acid-resistance protein [Gemmatimonadota bacterium]
MGAPDGPPGGVFPASRLGWGRTWQAIAIAALLLFALGLILLIWPRETVVVAAILIGIALLVTGILRLVQGITAADESGGMRVAYVIIGILAILAGLYGLRHISVTVVLLAFIVGLFWAVHGVVEIVVAVSAPPGSGRGVVAVVGILSLAAGLIVMFWPAISLTILVVVLGIWLLCYGVLLAFLAFQLRTAARTAARG